MAISLAFINARLWTPPSDCKSAAGNVPAVTTASALGITGDKISIIGNESDILARCNADTLIIDAKRGMLLPGFTDSHVHFLDGGVRLLSVQLRKCKSKEDVTTALKQHIGKKPKGSWIIGGDWDHYLWGGVLPDKTWIDEVSMDHPLWLSRLDGHMYLANSLALKLAGIDRNTPDTDGGTIVRFDNGEPTGVFKDNATYLVTRVIPRRSYKESCEALEAAMTYVAKHGVTKVHTMVTLDCTCGAWPKDLGKDADKQDMEMAFEEISLYQEFMRQNKLRTRIRAALPIASWKRVMNDIMEISDPVTFKDLELAKVNGGVKSLLTDTVRSRCRLIDPTEFLQVGVLKAFMDGSLGTHTAAFYEDYSDTPGYKGNFIWDPSILYQYILDASANGLDICVHAIGDHANTVTLDMFKNVTQRLNEVINVATNSNETNNSHMKSHLDLRFRIEHAQHIRQCDIARFGNLNVIASMQMSHLADDGRWATDAIGEERMKTSWPMKSLLDSGAVVALGSDWFVSEPTPLQSIYDAVTRCTIDGSYPKGLVPSEKVSVEEALIGFTSAAAYAAHEEDRRGSLGVGMLADIVLLDTHILECDIEEIPKTNVLTTVVGGRIVFNKMDVNTKISNV